MPVSPGAVGCRSCQGRGWKLSSPRRMIRVTEGAVPLARRICLDCGGPDGGRSRDNQATIAPGDEHR